MNCPLCNRPDFTERELIVHIKYFHDKVHGKPAGQHIPTQKMSNGACQECGGMLWYEEGCVKCHSCGYTKCG